MTMLESLIPKLMEIKGWNARKLMVKCDISWNNAFGLSHGNIPGPKTLDKLCAAFDCQPGDLIMWKESE
jgi:DNA-binding Xre family transcriptional regulator